MLAFYKDGSLTLIKYLCLPSVYAQTQKMFIQNCCYRQTFDILFIAETLEKMRKEVFKNFTSSVSWEYFVSVFSYFLSFSGIWCVEWCASNIYLLPVSINKLDSLIVQTFPGI